MHHEPHLNSNGRYCDTASLRPTRIDPNIQSSQSLNSQEIHFSKQSQLINKPPFQVKRTIFDNSPSPSEYTPISNPSHVSTESSSSPPLRLQKPLAQLHVDPASYTHTSKCHSSIYDKEIHSRTHALIKPFHGTSHSMTSQKLFRTPSLSELKTTRPQTGYIYEIYPPPYSGPQHAHQHTHHPNYDRQSYPHLQNFYLSTPNSQNNVINKTLDFHIDKHLENKNSNPIIRPGFPKRNYETYKPPDEKSPPSKKKRTKSSKISTNTPNNTHKLEKLVKDEDEPPSGKKLNAELNQVIPRKPRPSPTKTEGGKSPSNTADTPPSQFTVKNLTTTYSSSSDQEDGKSKLRTPKSEQTTKIFETPTPPDTATPTTANESSTPSTSPLPSPEEQDKKSPIKGLYYDAHKKLWRVQWRINRTPNAKRTSKSFSESDNGFWLAKAKAALWALSEEIRSDYDSDEKIKTKHEIFFKEPQTTITLLEDFYKNYKHKGKKRDWKAESTTTNGHSKRIPLDLSLDSLIALLEEHFDKHIQAEKQVQKVMPMPTFLWHRPERTTPLPMLNSIFNPPDHLVYTQVLLGRPIDSNSPTNSVKKD